jgi:arginine decarboxylase
MSQNLLDALDGWTSVKSAELYGVGAWGQGHFMVTDDGFAAVNLKNATGTVRVNLSDIVHGLHDRGMSLPLLLRFSDLLGNRIRLINESFKKAIADYAYQNVYRGVFPIKVNQQQQAVHDVVTFGAPTMRARGPGPGDHIAGDGLYARSESLSDLQLYKDAEFIDLAPSSLKMGLQTIRFLKPRTN